MTRSQKRVYRSCNNSCENDKLISTIWGKNEFTLLSKMSLPRGSCNSCQNDKIIFMLKYQFNLYIFKYSILVLILLIEFIIDFKD